ncbi:MAG: RluA family pseudouridine synthase [Bacteroidales bacterium]|nr:RluA family pseudouridine synthase [Bacteroidales bacterium]MCM1146325.1 RluA family pseudouridine synthase [Bacteroidales bacterium]MCM1205237.1 RluA family pseudouridine synthase [Bacillota bacterium]MCM1509678.1 RluA family pseudouridine synthase [Clostridium sp.]
MDSCFFPLDTRHALPDKLNCPFYYRPHPLCMHAATAVQEEIRRMTVWNSDVGTGKMFGVLVVSDGAGNTGYLRAYSGQVFGRADWHGWVPAVFDYLQPDGYFSVHEAEISALNAEIAGLESSPRHLLDCAALAKAKEEGERRIAAYREFMADSKLRRAARRASGENGEALNRESQFQKAELRRMKFSVKESLRPLEETVAAYDLRLAERKLLRKRLSDSLQRWLFDRFVMLNGRGERRSLTEIFSATPVGVPPSGTGECCAPKLLQHAFLHGYRPLAIAEFWWGESPVGEIRRHGEYYPACQGKCKPVLDFMLQGVEVEENPLLLQEDRTELPVVFEDRWLLAVDKPAGMLSVPGKGRRLSAQDILSSDSVPVYACHRLDMQTSGILLFAKTEEMQRTVQGMFARREMKKMYVAVLDGICSCPSSGLIALPLSSDYANRPRQRVDLESGKAAETYYNIMYTREGKTFVELFPKTGRTHQLRVHCAYPDGLGVPIVGDDLYGRHAGRLLLNARRLEFVHPMTGEHVCLVSSDRVEDGEEGDV